MTRSDADHRLRRKCRALIDEIAEPLIAELVARVQTEVRARFEAALAPRPMAIRDPKPANKPANKRARRIAQERSTRPPRQAAVEARIDPPAPKQAAPAPNGFPAREATDITSKGAPRQRAVMRCGLCGEVGFRREGCGKTHNIAGSPMRGAIQKAKLSARPAKVAADDSEPDTFEPPSPAARADRFAKIEASVAKRTGVLPTPTATFVTGGRL